MPPCKADNIGNYQSTTTSAENGRAFVSQTDESDVEQALVDTNTTTTALKHDATSAYTAKSNSPDFDFCHEIQQLLHISIPSVMTQFSLLWVFLTSASVIGRTLGPTELAGYSLGSLVGNLTCLSVMVGALTAAETLMPRSFGAGHYRNLGMLAIRSVVVCGILLVIPIIPLCTCLRYVFERLGQDAHASRLAAEWVRVYLLGVPAVLVFRVTQRFLLAQQKPWPSVYTSVVPGFILHPVLLRIFVAEFGFLGSAMAIVSTQWIMVISLYTYLHFVPGTVHPETWPGLSISFIQESLAPKATRQFLHLCFGGVLSLTEWWMWETMCFIAGTFGVAQLCAHTIAYNIIPLLFITPLGFSIGLTVRMGCLIEKHHVHKAQKLAYVTVIFIAILGSITGCLLYVFRMPVIYMFTNDEVVINYTLEIWGLLCIHVAIMHVMGINSGILRGLGLQWHMASLVIIILWGIQLPAVYWFAIRLHGGLVAQWSLMPFFYFIFQVCVVYLYTYIHDWEGLHKPTTDIVAPVVSSLPLSAPTTATSDEATPLIG